MFENMGGRNGRRVAGLGGNKPRRYDIRAAWPSTHRARAQSPARYIDGNPAKNYKQKVNNKTKSQQRNSFDSLHTVVCVN